MSTTLHAARNRLTLHWWGLFALLFIFIFVITMKGGFGGGLNSLSGFSWLGECTLPIGTLMLLVVVIIDHEEISKLDIDNIHLYRLSLCSIYFYYILLFATFIIQPWTNFSINDLLIISGLALAAVQGAVMTIIGKFFVETVKPRQRRHPTDPSALPTGKSNAE